MPGPEGRVAHDLVTARETDGGEWIVALGEVEVEEPLRGEDAAARGRSGRVGLRARVLALVERVRDELDR